jgi:two-component system sensor histidine kinase/response regulator
MPEMDGFEATRIIRESPGLANLPIIAMTAHALEDERRHCLAIGMNDHVAKPIDPPALREALIRWIAPHKSESVAGHPPKEAVPVSDFPTTLPGVDLTAALARLSGNRKLFLKLLRNFGENWAGVVATLHTSLAAGDHPGACLTVHTLRGVAGNLAIAGVASAAEALEQALKREERSEIEHCLKTVAEVLMPVLAGLERLPPEPPSPVATGPLDRQVLERQISELATLLHQHNMKAENCFAMLRAHLGGGEWSEALNRMEEQMDRLDFSTAASTLTEVAELLGVEKGK